MFTSFAFLVKNKQTNKQQTNNKQTTNKQQTNKQTNNVLFCIYYVQSLARSVGHACLVALTCSAKMQSSH